MTSTEPAWIATFAGGDRVEYSSPPVAKMADTDRSRLEWLSVKWRGRQYNLNLRRAVLAIDDGRFVALDVAVPRGAKPSASATMSAELRLSLHAQHAPAPELATTRSVTFGVIWDGGRALVTVRADGTVETSTGIG